MSNSEAFLPVGPFRFKDVYGVFVLSPDDVQFRTGSLSGTACVLSDPKRRGLLGPLVEKLLSGDEMQRRPWNEAEAELLEEVIPQLAEAVSLTPTNCRRRQVSAMALLPQFYPRI